MRGKRLVAVMLEQCDVNVDCCVAVLYDRPTLVRLYNVEQLVQ